MDFELTEEMKMLRDMTYKFAQTEIAPIAQECDREEKYTPELRKKAAENGLVAAWVPEEYSGSGVGILGNTLVTEELSKVDMGIGGNVIAASFGCENIYFNGSEEQKQKYLPPVCRGEQVCAGAYTEPNAGTDVSGYKTRAVKDGSDYVINGNKMFITNANICDFMVVACVTNPDAKSVYQGFSLIIVPADAPGITVTKIHGKLGIRATDTGEIAYEDVRAPQKNLIGKEGKGFPYLMQFFDTTRVMVAAQAVGLSQACLDTSIRYAKERTAFRSPLVSFQLIQEKIAQMAIKTEALRNMTYKSAWLIDEERPDYTLAAMAKYLGGETATYCADAAVQIHGGYGYIDEYDVQRWYRDAKILDIYEGTREAEVMTIARMLVAKY
jgi:Acyl-CoA dehydrogenases